ncbi:nitrite reductase small subunit NirD [Meiothermus sp. CFH 77666]|uniref:nitrite reductase small subunit NirD n=1 Tax=Meiothermus sp. CFH 77666 TaxID=2817942 RepID=UPI001AA02856|nr:nitrite reductase small subunit NirD [Meiothermus sp. CFH 77666]MBO1436874.1 nitrite reductase small subunit NirD [Meiothermus sp. CFH 77666]
MTKANRCWRHICRLEEILEGTGVCAKVEGRQVAVFRLEGKLYALSNYDPFTRANVLSRGILGNRGERRYVASPLLKHRFDLETGECLDDAQVCIPTYAVRCERGEVWVGLLGRER